MIHEAVVLAAGRGLRLGSDESPKPLTDVCGVTLLHRALRTLAAEGVTRAVVVVGYRRGDIRGALAKEPILGLELVVVENDEWERQNGVSVLCAAPHIRGDFFLTMADHVFDRGVVRALQQAGIPEGGLSLAVDRLIDTVFDIDDATKVETEGDRIVAIGKTLPKYDAIDTGVFACTRGLFESLARVKAARNDASLSDGVGELARAGKARAVDVSGSLWHDVDTQEALREAERRLLASLRKPADGIVSRHLNRYLSLALTRFLCKTKLRPNHATMMTLVLGIGAALAAAVGDYWFGVLGGFLYQWKSIVDGVDGELARLKFQGSPFGAWLDTLVDDATNWIFYAGVAVGAYRASGDATWLYAGAAAVVLAIACSAVMYHWIWTRKHTGDLLAFEWFWETKAAASGASSSGKPRSTSSPASSGLGSKLKLLAKQDFFCFFFFALSLAGVLPVIVYLVLTMGVVLLSLLAVQYTREAKVLQIHS